MLSSTRKVLLLFAVLSVASIFAHKLPFDVDDDEQSGDSEIEEMIYRTSSLTPLQRSNDTKSSTDDDAIIELFSSRQQNKNDQKQRQQQRIESTTIKLQVKTTKKMASSTTTSTATPSTNLQMKAKPLNLSDDVNDFIELIPKAETKAKVEEYYRNDMDVQHIFEFVHGKEFQELKRSVFDLADVKDILQYLNRNGLNVKGVVRKIDNRLGISKIRPNSLTYATPQAFATNTTIGGVNGLVEDILTLLPQDEIFILFFEKLDSSPKFSAFIQCIGNPDFHRKYNSLWKSKEIHMAAAQLKKHKIDLAKIIQILQGYFIFGTF